MIAAFAHDCPHVIGQTPAAFASLLREIAWRISAMRGRLSHRRRNRGKAAQKSISVPLSSPAPCETGSRRSTNAAFYRWPPIARFHHALS